MATSPSSKQQSGLSKYGDLKGRLIFLALALVVYRIGAHVPVPGIDPDMLNQLFNQRHPRAVQHVLRRCPLALLRLCARDHAVHFSIHYFPDAVVRASVA